MPSHKVYKVPVILRIIEFQVFEPRKQRLSPELPVLGPKPLPLHLLFVPRYAKLLQALPGNSDDRLNSSVPSMKLPRNGVDVLKVVASTVVDEVLEVGV
jgi:hypothetical protein